MIKYTKTSQEEYQRQDQVKGAVVVVPLSVEVVEVHQVATYQEHQEVGVLSVLDVFISPSSWALPSISGILQEIDQGKPRL